MKRIFLCAAILGITVVSCKKEKKDDSVPSPCVIGTAYIAGIYKTTAIRYKASSSAPEQDYFATLPACEKDDIIKLNVNGTADYQDAGTVCTPNGSYSGTWTLNGDLITIDGTPGSIQLFDCKKLVVSASGVIVPGDNIIITYQKQ